jgi:hypothetical protein
MNFLHTHFALYLALPRVEITSRDHTQFLLFCIVTASKKDMGLVAGVNALATFRKFLFVTPTYT